VFDQPERFAPWKRYLLGSIVMIVVGSIVASLTAFSQREDLVTVFKKNEIKGISKYLDGATGGPQTILLIGADARKGDKKLGLKPRSDTMMLVRLDPSKKVTSVLSVPRDLRVTIPGRGVAKFNESYTLGGAKLVVRTIKENFGLKVNHVAEVDFRGFAQAVDAIDCVYIDVDRKYFNDNAGAVYGQQFAAIDIKAGYQKLCGYRSLDYVRFRHYDSDIFREARQQGFLRQAKQQVGVTELFTSARKLKKIIANNIRTDNSLSSGKNLQRLLTLAVKSAGKPVYQVEIPGVTTPTLGGVSYVVASNENLEKAGDTFLKGPRQKGEVDETPDIAGDGANPVKRQVKRGKRVKSLPSTMIAAKDAGKKQAAIVAPRTKIPVFYPTALVNGAEYKDEHTRGYRMTTAVGKRASAYRIVAKINNSAGDFYGIQGVHWINPPILKHPSETRKVGGREYQLYYEGSKLALVSFRRGSNSYWVSNTLTRKLTGKQMMALAQSLRLRK
jgi:LCP family protein required for cell wall assembly